MSVRVSVGALFVLCCFISGTSAWWPFPHFDEEVPENCPHRNNDTHVCSTLESNIHPCKYRYCCGEYDWDNNEDTDECENGICWTFRYCVNYSCRNSCCDGYIGDWQTGCQVDTDECQNGGTRRRGYWSRCNCLPGFRGRRCETPICECHNRGHCVVRDNEPVCECPPGFTGTTCEQPICTEECLNGGTCVGDGRDGFCVCPEGFVGDQCEHEYINSEKCPSQDLYSSEKGTGVECNSDEECDGEKVCCNEGSSLICRKPKPTSCYYKGQEHPLNSIFHPEPCMTCECFETGHFECRSVACAMPECDEPIIHPDQCCPTCPTAEPITCEHNGIIYSDGVTFKDDCNECTCTSGQVACTEMACSEPITCEHKGIIYSDGVTFKDDCNECTCTSGQVACTEMACPEKEPCTVEDGSVYESGTSFKIDCNTCQCSNGTYACTKMNCGCTLPCENDGRCISEGEDETCHCEPPFRGELCQIRYENPENCPEPESWALENTETEACRTTCESNEDCIEDEICCMEGCHMICRAPKKVTCKYEGREFTLGDSYSPDPCKFCHCSEDGSMMCAVVDCALPECPGGEDPVSRPDKCCPVCPEPPKECKHNGHTYQEGESFKDDCNTCNCRRGEVSCTEMACPVRPELECPNSVVELHLPPKFSSLELTKELTNVKAQADGRNIQVRFEPSHVHHCRCLNSDDMVYTAIAYASYNGITERCRFSYIVKDVTPPVFITCPEDIYVFEHEDVTYKRPEYWDNVGIAKARCAMDSNRRTYPPGNYSFNYQVMDFEGNHASCSFLLSVTSSDTPYGQLPQGLKNRSTRGPHIAMIVAPIAGLLVVILMIVLFLWCCRFRRASNRASTPQHRPRDAFDNHIYSIPADVKAPDYNSLPPNPPAYHSDNVSIHSDYAFLPPPAYKEVEELKAPTGYVNQDYSTIGSVKDSVKSRDA